MRVSKSRDGCCTGSTGLGAWQCARGGPEVRSAHARAWLAAPEALGAATALDAKTEHLAHLTVLAALRLVSGVPFHVGLAKQAGASRNEIIGTILLGLPAAGNAVTESLPVALAAYDGA